MRIPRFSIAGLMAATVVLGLDLAAIRASRSLPGGELRMAVGFSLPMVSLLAFGALVLIQSRLRRSEASPFLAGFVAFGSLATVAALGLAVAWPDGLMEYFEVVLGPADRLLRSMGYPGYDPTWGPIFDYTIGPQPIFLPQVLVAAFGGWLNTRYRVTITRRRPPGARFAGAVVEGPDAARPASPA